MKMMMVVVLLPTLGPFRNDESSKEIIFIKLLEQELGISVKGLTVLLWKESQERDLTICEVILLLGPEIVRTEDAQRREIHGAIGKVEWAMSL